MKNQLRDYITGATSAFDLFGIMDLPSVAKASGMKLGSLECDFFMIGRDLCTVAARYESVEQKQKADQANPAQPELPGIR